MRWTASYERIVIAAIAAVTSIIVSTINSGECSNVYRVGEYVVSLAIPFTGG